MTTSFALRMSHPVFPQTGLKVASVFRMGKLATLHHTLILRRLGRAAAIQPSLDLALKHAVGLDQGYA